MNQTYDVIVCGTGFSECILSGLLSTSGKKVLHVDRNPYYGGESASLNLTNLFRKFPRRDSDRLKQGGRASPPEHVSSSTASSATSSAKHCDGLNYSIGPYSAAPESWGLNRDWNVDLVPKFIMANGKLVKILLKTGVKDYLEFQIVEGSFVYQHQKSGWWPGEKFIHKVPATESEALTSGLVGLTEKLKARSFFAFIASYQDDKPDTWLVSPGGVRLNPHETSMQVCYKHFGVSSSIIEFVGHAIALHTSEDYLTHPMSQTMNKLKLYLMSLLRYGNSPFIYPMYGLGTLPEGFSRLSAVYGGVYMLNNPIKNFIIDSTTNKIRGIQSVDGQIALADILICDPTYCLGIETTSGDGGGGTTTPEGGSGGGAYYYDENPEGTTPSLAIPSNCHLSRCLPNKVKKIGRVIRIINILNSPIPGTEKRKSCQIILPQAQLGRKTDIYVAMISSNHGICSEGKYVVLVSGNIETTDQDPVKEMEPALKLLGPIEHQFVSISDLYEATDNGKSDNIFVTNSYDAQSHFESATENVLNIWRNINGAELDLRVTHTRNENGEIQSS